MIHEGAACVTVRLIRVHFAGGGGGILPLSAMSAFVSFLGVILLSALSKLMPILFNFCPICQFGPLFCPF